LEGGHGGFVLEFRETATACCEAVPLTSTALVKYGGNLDRTRLQNRNSTEHGFINTHARSGLAVYFLFRRIHAVSFRVNREAMDLLLDRKVFEFPVVIRIIHLENGDRSAPASCINALEAGIELDHVRPACHWQEGDRLVLVQIEHGH